MIKSLTYVLALCFAFGCARARLERLAQAAQPFDKEKVEAALPVPVEPRTDFEITHRVELKTNYGTMVLALYGKDAPDTVRNFVSYVKSGFYSGMVFHRVIPGFMIQGGGYNAEMEKPDTGDSIDLELIPGLEHKAGTISMARTTEPSSATSQFFICVADTVQLNGQYSAFGTVEEGIDVAEKISTVATHSVETDFAVMDDVPVTPVVIEEARLLKLK
ncbi:MAG: peptidylprolyl isomerase [Deltaproteobacteria bacterium]|nr:peptidylprolyl isomerase [Deltaproteobacteria bacterium]MBN2673680.1 peptidylprolyl isomerase [Deltaproteobacteria bacterium]